MRKIGGVLRALVFAAIALGVVAGAFVAGYGAHWATVLPEGTPAVAD
ncbi:MAG: hypothetical protein H5T59_12895, partial [Anaerolineae bacterium]|nr:hypothetical protein [Anaerolineae bacterium]